MKKFTGLCLFLLTLAMSQPLLAQVTSSTIVGKITDEKGESLQGVTVVATHLPTGTNYGTVTDADGRYVLPNLKSGGPYLVKASIISYKIATTEELNLALGVTTTLNYKMSEGTTQLNEVTITSQKDVKTGSSTNVKKEQLQTLPTISRSITDMTRLTPQSSNNSFAGTNFRYNNITLDGAINNDAIGFSPSLGGVSGTSGMPASSTRSNPFSLDAIQEVQVAVSPFDVTLGNFTGGSINAVTRSGTNEVTGSVYAFGRNSTITGKSVDGTNSAMPSNYYDYQSGFRVGLPLIKNKLFLFTNAEVTHRQEPVFYGAGQNGSFMNPALAQRITDSLNSHTFMSSPYEASSTMANPGSYGSYAIQTNSNKIFARVDWNINDKHQLTLRHNYVGSNAGNLERSVNQFKFGSQDFIQNNVLNSTVLELKSRFSNRTSNSLILGYTNIHDYRDPVGTIMPQIQINSVAASADTSARGTGTILLGTDREAAIFNTRQNSFEFTDNFKYYYKRHSFTLGTHNEFYKIDYGFINSWNGRFEYNNVAQFFENRPSRMRAFYNLGDNSRDYNYNNPSASFNIYLMSAYVQDDWSINDKLKVTPGLRFDMAYIPNGPTLSPQVQNNVNDAQMGTTYTHTPLNQLNNKLFGQVMVSPRIGFNYDVNGDGKWIVRGGSGLFTGRIPFAWLGYAYYNNGVNFGAFDYKPAGKVVVPIPTDPTKFQTFGTSVDNVGRREVDLIDNNFHMPQVWRSSLATDIKLPAGYKLTLEFIYTKTIYDIQFQMVNLKDTVRYDPSDVNHQQPIYIGSGPNGQRVNNSFSNAYLLTNTNKGYRYNMTVQLSKNYKFGLYAMAAYTYGVSYDISNGIRNSPESNWQLNPSLVANNPGLAYSNFDLRHRIISNLGYKKSWNKSLSSYVSVVFSAQSGSPYTYTYNLGTDYNGAGQQLTLAYIPANKNDIIFADANGNKITNQAQIDQLWSALDKNISDDKYLSTRRGKFTERNAARTPWNFQADLRLMQDFNMTVGKKIHTLQVSFDIINFTNLLSSAWGRVYFVPNTFNSGAATGLTPSGTDPVTGKRMFSYSAPTTTPWAIDQLASRWQGQLGVRYSF